MYTILLNTTTKGLIERTHMLIVVNQKQFLKISTYIGVSFFVRLCENALMLCLLFGLFFCLRSFDAFMLPNNVDPKNN